MATVVYSSYNVDMSAVRVLSFASGVVVKAPCILSVLLTRIAPYLILIFLIVRWT